MQDSLISPCTNPADLPTVVSSSDEGAIFGKARIEQKGTTVPLHADKLVQVFQVSILLPKSHIILYLSAHTAVSLFHLPLCQPHPPCWTSPHPCSPLCLNVQVLQHLDFLVKVLSTAVPQHCQDSIQNNGETNNDLEISMRVFSKERWKPCWYSSPICHAARNTRAGAAFFCTHTPDKLSSKQSLERRALVGPVVYSAQRVSDK